MQIEHEEKERQLKRTKARERIIGTAYDQLKGRIIKFAEKDKPVLFVGETGTGKELLASYYMDSSNRPGKKMTVNCAAYTDTLLRSEVFGHVKGAFTDALNNRQGHLKTCDRGILFLDELDDASHEFQAAILRISEGHPFNRLGSDEQIKVDTLIISATNNPLEIRDDLKQRFNILPVPPLQREDIPTLSQHFLGKPLKKEFLENLMAREYLGNVRELKKECENLLIKNGEGIFTRKKEFIDTDINKIIFDYDRFEQEYILWNRYIAPIVQKYQLGFGYKYFALPDERPEELPPRTPSSSFIFTLEMPGARKVSNILSKMPEWIESLRVGARQEEFLPLFVESLNAFFQIKNLNLLLLSLDSSLRNRTPIEAKPDLTPLLNLRPREALEEFQRIYLNYHLKKHSDNRNETARALGVAYSTLKSQIRALRKK